MTMDTKKSRGEFFEHKHPSELKSLNIYPAGDATLLTKTSPYYRQVTYDADIAECGDKRLL